ncbi:MAG: pyruvate, phosphate dikinase [Candidatus Delongbacteria bacterium]|nr:pyruvate, phosphate dikinase [Candidatus Delongbacteria bacterium]
MPAKKVSTRTAVYYFGDGKADGNGNMKELLGGKGANLAEMTLVGLPVPAGFTISTEMCHAYEKAGHKLKPALKQEVQQNLAKVEKVMGKKFGDADDPLLLSVRSGSRASMPGMMDTVLNLGLNDISVEGLNAKTSNPRFSYDSYRRFIQMYGDVVMKAGAGLEHDPYHLILENYKTEHGYKSDLELKVKDLKAVIELYKAETRRLTGSIFPQDPLQQLWGSIGAVFQSWKTRRAQEYRRQNKIPSDWGTAVNIQAMVFGNMGKDSGTGVCFTRDPATGEKRFYGEYLMDAQGEDVVAGIRTPLPISRLEKANPKIYRQLYGYCRKMERHYTDMQDLEFTIQQGKLFMLQTRVGKRTGSAAVRIAVEMVKERLITTEEAIRRIDPDQLEQLLFPRLDPKAKREAVTTGVAASPGATSGEIVFDADQAEELGKQGRSLILVREETKPEDIHGFFAARGILTSRGGKTSHAAVVARGMGKPSVTGAEAITINLHAGTAIIGDHTLRKGDVITIDGSSGKVYIGEVPTVEAEFSKELETLLQWADKIAHLKVKGNADTPLDARRAREFGARGIGLCRTERMFNSVDRLPVMVEMILAETTEERQSHLDKLLEMQREDFTGLFKAMSPYPVTVRLLDPPLHEFLPNILELEEELHHARQLRLLVSDMDGKSQTALEVIDPDVRERCEKEIRSIHKKLNHLLTRGIGEDYILRKEKILAKVRALAETNPMLGHRGVRLGISFPEIYKMQIRAILEAAAICRKEKIEIHPEIMVPQVCTLQELIHVHSFLKELHPEVEQAYGVKVPYRFGSMIEVVRACMRAGHLAEIAEFFSFGTNDLTQATFSFSREDAESKFLALYNRSNILLDNPFEVLDQEGVARLMKIAIEWGRKTRPGLEVGICGEHGGHPGSIALCHSLGLDYVSASPPRVPVARLAAARAALARSTSKPAGKSAPQKVTATRPSRKANTRKKAVAAKK